MHNIISRKGLLFLALFTALALVGMQINFSSIIGQENQFFTLYQFFGPIAGGFLGIFGGVAVLGAQIVDYVLVGKEITAINLLRLLPMVFAALYFGRNWLRGIKDILGVAVPVLAMLAFWLHPTGQAAWIYALWWIIPVAAKFLPDNLVLRSLGATFTAHCIGSVVWLYTIPMPAEAWLALIPVVAFERGLFALGIAGSYVAFTNVLNTVDKAFHIGKYVNVEKRYLLHL
ncbi:MAG: hypothetical protein ABII71_04575 [Candidatus Micrarchaeota archaeon]